MRHLEKWLQTGIEEAIPKIERLSQGHLTAKIVQAHEVHIHELPALTEREASITTGIAMTLLNSPSVKLLVLLSPKAAETIIQSIVGQDGLTDQALGISVLQEIGNIFGSVIANCISKNTNIPITTSIPEICDDMVGAMVSSIISDMPSLGDTVAFTNTRFLVDNEKIDCEIYLFSDSINKQISNKTITNGGLYEE